MVHVELWNDGSTDHPKGVRYRVTKKNKLVVFDELGQTVSKYGRREWAAAWSEGA